VCATRTTTETALRASPSQQSLARSTPPAPTSAGRHNPERPETVAPSHCHRRRSRRRRHHGSHSRHRAGRKGQQTPPSPEGQKAPTQRIARAPHPDSLPASREVHHRVLHARQGRRTSATCRSDQQPQHEDKASRRQTPALATTAVGAARVGRRPASSRHTHIPQLSSHDHQIQPAENRLWWS
jgi:hypothetical protein